MADCLGISKGRKLGCKNAVGGYKAAYFINGDTDVVFNISTGNTSVVQSISALTVDEVYKYELKATSNTVTVDATTSRDAGTTFYSQVAVLNLAKIDEEMTNQLKFMAIGNPKIVIEDYMGNFLLLGKDNGADLTAGQILTGGAKGDANGYVLTFTGEEVDPLFHLSAAAKATLLANVADNE
jgi:hypothetical protein